jgi:hypothetical protein
MPVLSARCNCVGTAIMRSAAAAISDEPTRPSYLGQCLRLSYRLRSLCFYLLF